MRRCRSATSAHRQARGAASRLGLRLLCRGIVQGVGFRPSACRLAQQLGLEGRLTNAPGSVRLELAGPRSRLEAFLRQLPNALLPPARLLELETQWLTPPLPAWLAPGCGLTLSAAPPRPLQEGWWAASLLADRAPCPDCRAELDDPHSRRYRYPFLSCSRCGPRYSIATAEPWCRAHTSLAAFPLCAACRQEFEDPADRRFHAETIACPACGPRLQLRWLGPPPPPAPPLAEGPGGPDPPCPVEAGLDPLLAAAALLRAGGILALQGVGGFQLLVDAGDGAAVARLRRRKRRSGKPFALLVVDSSALASLVRLEAAEQAALADPAAPIVLLRRHPDAAAALPGVASGSPLLGVMLPASPLHLLLARAVGRPLVCTSGNRSGEPMCIDPQEAATRLAGIADALLVHDRPIQRRLEDSLLQVVEGRPLLLRRARGFAPEMVPLAPAPSGRETVGGAQDPAAMLQQAEPSTAAAVVIGLGSDLKSAPALAIGAQCWLAPHLGDLAEGRSLRRLEQGLWEWLRAQDPKTNGPSAPGSIGVSLGCDAHPGYLSHQLAASIAASCAAAGEHLDADSHPGPAAAPEPFRGQAASRGLAAGQGPGGDRAEPIALPLGQGSFPLWAVPHHLAHGLAVVAEHGLRPPLLLVAFDGLGYGPPSGQAPDPRPAWRGGELLWLHSHPDGSWRVEAAASLRPFALPGGERALLEPRRCALGLVDRAAAHDHPGAWRLRRAFAAADRRLLLQALAAGCQSPECSSIGRLFDAVASLLGLVQVLAFEGQGGLRLQAAAERALARAGVVAGDRLPLRPAAAGHLWLDWEPLLAEVLDGAVVGADRQRTAARFHLGLAEGLAAALTQLLRRRDLSPGAVPVALAGGCFQNRLLLERSAAALRCRGFRVHWSEAVPGNDGGLALGQIQAVRQVHRQPS